MVIIVPFLCHSPLISYSSFHFCKEGAFSPYTPLLRDISSFSNQPRIFKFRLRLFSITSKIDREALFSHHDKQFTSLPQRLHSLLLPKIYFSPINLVEPEEPPEEQLPRALKLRTWALAVTVILSIAGAPSPALAWDFNWLGAPRAEQNDPVEPFTLYGSILKKYLIEQIVDGKVVGRKKGFTTSTCVVALDSPTATPLLKGASTKLKLLFQEDPACMKSEAESKEESCSISCKDACKNSIKHHLVIVKEDTGFNLEVSAREKAVRACSSECAKECIKPGKTSWFLLPYRPPR